jgi:hypothetical protein
MANKIQLKSIKTNVSGFTSVKDVDNHLRNTLTLLIAEINDVFSDNVHELAEVKKVYVTENDLPKDNDGVPKYELLGGIEFKNISGKGKSSGLPAKSLNPNLKQVPVEGEYVLIQRFFGHYYYTPQVNVFNSPNNSSYQGYDTRFQKINKSITSNETIEQDNTGIVENKSANQVRTLGDKFLPNFNFRQVIPEEGSVILNGRFGNSIRLGSNIKNGLQDSPNIKLRAGQLQDVTKFGEESLVEELNTKPIAAGVEENINSDGSSMWMTTDEVVSLTPATLEDPNIYPSSVAPEVFDGKQIILNSGRLIFNSKEDGILGFSNGPIDLSTLDVFSVSAKQRLDLYSPTISVGRRDKTKNINLNTSNVTVRGDSGRTLVRANKIKLLGPVEGEDIRRAGKLQPVIRDGVVVAPRGKDIQVSPAVRGTELREVLEDMIDIMRTLTTGVNQLAGAVSSGLPVAVGGPSAVGLQSQQAAQVVANVSANIFKQLDTKFKLPTLLSRVVEIE